MSIKSQVFSLLKFGQQFLKYSSLIFLTKWVSQSNASWWLLINTLWRGVISSCFKLGGPSGVTLDVVLLRTKISIRSGEWCCHLGPGEGPGMVWEEGEEALGASPCWEEDAPWGMLKRWEISVCPSSTWYKASSMLQDLRGLASRVAWQTERKVSWPLLSYSMASSSRCWMPLACDCWMKLAWQAPQASTSLMAVEQQASTSLIEWAQVVSASLMEWA